MGGENQKIQFRFFRHHQSSTMAPTDCHAASEIIVVMVDGEERLSVVSFIPASFG